MTSLGEGLISQEWCRGEKEDDVNECAGKLRRRIRVAVMTLRGKWLLGAVCCSRSLPPPPGAIRRRFLTPPLGPLIFTANFHRRHQVRSPLRALLTYFTLILTYFSCYASSSSSSTKYFICLFDTYILLYYILLIFYNSHCAIITARWHLRVLCRDIAEVGRRNDGRKQIIVDNELIYIYVYLFICINLYMYIYLSSQSICICVFCINLYMYNFCTNFYNY